MKEIFDSVKNFFAKYEKRLSVAAFITGFVVDNLTLTRIDLLFDNLVLFSYLAVAGGVIVFLSFSERGIFVGKFFAPARSLAPLAMQFAFGGLFSGFFIFYSRSASLPASWPFLFVLLFLLLGNEFFKTRYTKTTFQISIFYFTLFSFLIFYVPIIVGSMSAWIFLLSGFLSIVTIKLFIKLLVRISPNEMHASRNLLVASIAVIFITVNIMYFTNIIPPIPLSLKDAGIYHFVERENGNYKVSYEKRLWREYLPFVDKVIHRAHGEQIYFYSAVFAPTKISVPVFHEWQYFNEAAGEWVTASKIGFPISGGRDGGYRGYTVKEALMPGKWRVNIITERGQILGRTSFIIEDTKSVPILEQKLI